MTKLIKVFVSLATSKDGRKVLMTTFIIAVSPLILIILMIVSIADGTSKHNNHLIETLFHDAQVSDSTPKEYQLVIEKYKNLFDEIDKQISLLENVRGSFDNTLIKSILLTYFINNKDFNYLISIDNYLSNFYELENVEETNDEGITEEVIYKVVILDTNRLLNNASTFLDFDLLEKQIQVSEIYNVALTGSSQDIEQYIPMSALLKDLYIESENTPYIGGIFSSPFEDDWRKHVSSEFGARTPIILPDGTNTGDYHTGIDMARPLGTSLLSIGNGKVVAVRHTNIGLGLFVVIDHGGGVFSVYGHMARIYVKENQILNVGDKIGEVGSTGYSTGPHLHLEIIKDRNYVNPRKYLK